MSESPYKEENPYLHIHAQAQWHDDAFIVANKQALLLMKKAIEDALEKGYGYVPAFAGDGEGFNTLIARIDHSESFEKLGIGYTDEIAAQHQPDGVIWPWDMKRMDEASREARAWLDEKYSKKDADDVRRAYEDDKKRLIDDKKWLD